MPMPILTEPLILFFMSSSEFFQGLTLTRLRAGDLVDQVSPEMVGPSSTSIHSPIAGPCVLAALWSLPLLPGPLSFQGVLESV